MMSVGGGFWDRVTNARELRAEIDRLRCELDQELRKNGLLTERLAQLQAKYEHLNGTLLESMAVLSQLKPKLDILATGQEQTKTSLACLERTVKTIATQLEEMDAKLTIIADTETVLGQSIQKVIDYLKSNPNPTPTDLTAQLGVLDNIANRLIATNAQTLANLPPTPEPVPEPTPEPTPPPERRR